MKLDPSDRPRSTSESASSLRTCVLYESAAQRRRALTEVLSEGLAAGEQVLVVMDEEPLAAVPLLLSEASDALDRARRDGRVRLVSLQELDWAGGAVLPEALVARLREATEGVLRARGAGLRVVLELPAADPVPAEERRLAELRLYHTGPGAGAVWYRFLDRRGTPADALLDALRTHDEVWLGSQRFENSYRLPPVVWPEAARREGELQAWLAHLEQDHAVREALAAGQHQYRDLFDSLISGFALHELIYDETGKPIDYRFLEVNPAFQSLTGLEAAQVVGRRVSEVIPNLEESWVERYARVVETGEPARFLDRAEGLGRVYEVVAYRPRLGQFAVIFNDVTAQVRAEEAERAATQRLYEAQRLESLGLLAGTVAHDFNNMLVGILGNASIALADLPPHASARECLVDIELAAQRAAEFVRQLLAYSGRGRFQVEPVAVVKLVEEMGHLLQATLPKSVSLRFELTRGRAVVDADASQLRQVVLNLIVNAAEAIGERSGVVTVAVGAMDCDQDYLDATFGAEELTEGRYVTLEVSDTGVGMDAAIRAQLFDPFFSTKRQGRGLGLAAVHGILRGHRGAIRVYSEPGRGTTFKILLPESASEAVVAEPAHAPEALPASGTVLVVDDEETVRVVARRALRRAGYDVLTAEDGREALAIFKVHRAEIVLVLLDMMMPRMGGAETLSALRRIAPEVRVILTSGYNEQDAVNRFAGRGLSGFIQKPYRAQDLLALVSQVIGERAAD